MQQANMQIDDLRFILAGILRAPYFTREIQVVKKVVMKICLFRPIKFSESDATSAFNVYHTAKESDLSETTHKLTLA